MKIHGDYHANGYAHLEQLVPPEVAQAFLNGMKQDVGSRPIPLSRAQEHVNLLKRPAFEVHSQNYKPLLYFLWGLTPIIRDIVGRELLPAYDYFRIYRQGDVCRVHSDRYSCEHSLSLTLGYSDDRVWDLQIEKRKAEPSARVDEDFCGEDFASIPMQPGDAVLYQGVQHRHGRTVPNPNRWSAHLFLHWVDRDGPHRELAFDGQIQPAKIEFGFA